jgi:hypothetical protein
VPLGELALTQSFQNVSGALQAGGRNQPITNGKLRGDQITFNVGAAQYTGRVNGEEMTGTVTTEGSKSNWRATRAR